MSEILEGKIAEVVTEQERNAARLQEKNRQYKRSSLWFRSPSLFLMLPRAVVPRSPNCGVVVNGDQICLFIWRIAAILLQVTMCGLHYAVVIGVSFTAPIALAFKDL